jgi:hypothetical protein
MIKFFVFGFTALFSVSVLAGECKITIQKHLNHDERYVTSEESFQIESSEKCEQAAQILADACISPATASFNFKSSGMVIGRPKTQE